MSFVCSVCGERHESEWPALALPGPLYWFELSAEDQEKGELGTDDCVTPDGHFFVRCTLLLPIKENPNEHLNFGVWASLSEANYLRFADAFHATDQSKLGPMFGWFSNELGGMFDGSLNLRCHVYPQDNRQRPLIKLELTDHPLAVAQRDGLALVEAERILHESGAFEA